jgi:hypothetical protein
MTLRQRNPRNPVSQLLYLPGELVKHVLRVWIERICRHLVRSGGAPYAQIDAARGNGLQDAELLGNFQRRIVRQHDTRAANADTRRGSRDRRHEYLGRGADDTAGVVVLRKPVAMITQRVAMAGEFECFPDRSVLRSSPGCRRLIEY